MLQLDNVSFAYGARAGSGPPEGSAGAQSVIDRVSLLVTRGQLVGVLGPNGSGKSTLLGLMAGTLHPSSGRVTLDGDDVRAVTRRSLARRLSYVPQETRLAFEYSVMEVALMGRYPHLSTLQLEGPGDVAIVREALSATGTAHLEARPFRTLSGGEKQRVIIAAALAQSAELMLLDEPTASLDLRYQLEIASLLRRLNRTRGMTLVVATHDLNFALSVCDALVLLRRGAVLAAGASSTVLAPDSVRALYGVDAHVGYDAVAAHAVVVPVAIASDADPAAPVSAARGTTQVSRRPADVRRRLVSTLPWFAALVVLACLTAPLVGSTTISLARVFDRSVPFDRNVDAQIFFIARLPRSLAGALVGATLASSGVIMQALLRNPLAAPDTLGVSAGAALGAMIALTFDVRLGFPAVPPVALVSFLGSLGAMTIVYALARARQRALSTNVLLLAGVTLNALLSAVILFVQFLADFSQTFKTVQWLLGDLDVAGYGPILGALPFTILAFLGFGMLPRALNLMSVDEGSAATRGVNVIRAQRLAFLSASVATGAAVSLAGPIGFIGIVVPHLVRLLVGADHRIVLPAAALFGAAFLVGCDVVARTVLAPLELPVGIVTAMVGGPFFLTLLIRRR
ncbi:MAG: iron chelate uptake ABC transporter family permease subunit [Acidobacteria bacterium]|nr:iron chelate uptake ABC transporter family permease subunit [Acidobacteriota bacterium]